MEWELTVQLAYIVRLCGTKLESGGREVSAKVNIPRQYDLDASDFTLYSKFDVFPYTVVGKRKLTPL